MSKMRTFVALGVTTGCLLFAGASSARVVVYTTPYYGYYTPVVYTYSYPAVYYTPAIKRVYYGRPAHYHCRHRNCYYYGHYRRW